MQCWKYPTLYYCRTNDLFFEIFHGEYSLAGVSYKGSICIYIDDVTILFVVFQWTLVCQLLHYVALIFDRNVAYYNVPIEFFIFIIACLRWNEQYCAPSPIVVTSGTSKFVVWRLSTFCALKLLLLLVIMILVDVFSQLRIYKYKLKERP